MFDFLKYNINLNDKLLEAFLDISLTFISINILDFFMTSVSIPLYTEILFAILCYLFSECRDYFFK
jgi:hypothetical protein